MSDPAMTDWQKVRYGDTKEARAALAYWRARGWKVDNPDFTRDTNEIETRVYAFMSGYEAAQSTLLAHVQALEAREARLREALPNPDAAPLFERTTLRQIAQAILQDDSYPTIYADVVAQALWDTWKKAALASQEADRG